MRSIRTYLIVVLVLLGIAVASGIVVWYLYQNLDGAQPNAMPLYEEVTDAPVPRDATTSTETVEPIVLDVSTLSEGQRDALTTFGFEDTEITITEAQIICAREAVGAARLDEIAGGAAPSPLEAMKLLPCFKK